MSDQGCRVKSVGSPAGRYETVTATDTTAEAPATTKPTL
ncbi:hypothetical protein BN903_18 [Halorubrum sp. AJ67]|nr:hypothetical protein BN903_18 [Halorubrum sp. AJ67]